jgi:hypothetical protein
MQALLLSLVTAIPLLAQSSTSAGLKSKSAQDNWDAPTQAAPNPQGSKPGKSDTKNVADGAAKGQASEGIVKERDMGSPGISGADGAAKGQATEGIYYKPHDTSSPGKADTKNVADGAAKGQATEGVDPNPSGGSGGGKGNNAVIKDSKNISDGAAKGQAVDGMDQNPNGGSGGGKGKNASADVHKNIADGAAKGQAVDGMDQNPNGGSGGGKGKNASINDSKNISDGAAKGQATDGIIRTQDSSSPGKEISDGAAKGQAQEITLAAPQNNGGGSGTGSADNFKSKSGTDDWNAPTLAAAPGTGSGTGKTDSINYNASKSNTASITVHKTVDSASPTVAGDPQPQPGMAVKGQGVPEHTRGTKKSATDDWNAPTSTAPPATGATKSKSAHDDWQSPN